MLAASQTGCWELALRTEKAQHDEHVIVDAVMFTAFSLKHVLDSTPPAPGSQALSMFTSSSYLLRCQACLYVGARLPAT